MKPSLIVVRATWDNEAKVWVAESGDIGLVTEAPTMEALRQKVPQMIIDLLECAGESADFDIATKYVLHQISVIGNQSQA